MTDRTRPSIMQAYDTEVTSLIARSRNIGDMDALRLFLGSETRAMLADNNLRLWHFSPLAVFDMWENEIATGDPRNSLYLRGDELE
ncbi:MAG: hypothetical protein IJO87_06565 [Eggerthellaceae bacterium]|nr:hypothetical protein [Eggerthellaceae bacterium]